MFAYKNTMPSPEDAGAALNAPPTVEVDNDYDEVTLERTAIEPYGRRSTAYLIPKTGQVVTYTGTMPTRLQVAPGLIAHSTTYHPQLFLSH
jgi:hypothetical protein